MDFMSWSFSVLGWYHRVSFSRIKLTGMTEEKSADTKQWPQKDDLELTPLYFYISFSNQKRDPTQWETVLTGKEKSEEECTT